MDTVDTADLTSWMDLDAEGLLGDQEKVRLEAHVSRLREESPDEAGRFGLEQRRWAALHRALADDHTPVRPDFHDRVMASVDLALWQREERVQAWKLPLAMLLIFALGAAWTLGGGGAAEHPILGTGSAIVDFLQTTALAGAGMTLAGWRGVGMGLEELFAGSPQAVIALGIAVVCLNLLLYSLLRRRVRPVAESSGGVDSAP